MVLKDGYPACMLPAALIEPVTAARMHVHVYEYAYVDAQTMLDRGTLASYHDSRSQNEG
jgi:hypothetical protein